MPELALKGMTLDDFLRWTDEIDGKYELIAGNPLAMAPPGGRHSLLATTLGSEIRTALLPRRPCRVYTEAGIILPHRNDAFYVADLAATSVPLGQDDRIQDPFLIVEILSPSTSRTDYLTKLPEYRHMPSVQEILLLDSETLFAEVLRREGNRWITELVQALDGFLTLNSVPLRISMTELYDGVMPSVVEGQKPGR